MRGEERERRDEVVENRKRRKFSTTKSADIIKFRSSTRQLDSSRRTPTPSHITSLHSAPSNMAPKRNRMDDDDKGGPSKVQLKVRPCAPLSPLSSSLVAHLSSNIQGLSWNANAAQPKFLKNALAALQGPKPARDLGDESGRPPIPTRPEGEEEEESEEDEWDMGRGEEAPAVVVLREGKHLGRDEVERMRAEGEFGR